MITTFWPGRTGCANAHKNKVILGLFLFGGCFVSVGLFISSLSKNQIVAGSVTFVIFLLLWVINWIGSFAGPTGDKLTSYLSIVDHFDDFGKGVIDTSHLTIEGVVDEIMAKLKAKGLTRT